jgi:putative ABC transport system substrate-binding protein
MRRRAFIAALGGAAAWPALARGQQTERVRRIGVLTSAAESDQEGQSSVAAFREELGKLGWVEGRNSEIDIRWAAANIELMRRFAKELAALQPDLILTSSTPAAAAMLQQTRTIPIVFVLVADPIGSGFVASLSRPGGNTTGFTPSWGRWVASGWSYSRRLRRGSPGSNYCSIRQRRRLSKLF